MFPTIAVLEAMILDYLEGWNAGLDPVSMALETYDAQINPVEPTELVAKVAAGLAICLHSETRSFLGLSQLKAVRQDIEGITSMLKSPTLRAPNGHIEFLLDLGFALKMHKGRQDPTALMYFERAVTRMPQSSCFASNAINSFGAALARHGYLSRSMQIVGHPTADRASAALMFGLSEPLKAISGQSSANAATWHDLWYTACRTGDLTKVAQNATDPDQRVRVYLLSHILGTRRGTRRLGRPRNILQNVRRTRSLDDSVANFMLVASRLDEYLTLRPNSQTMAQILDSLDDLMGLERLEDEILCMAFIAARLRQLGMNCEAGPIASEYQKLCLLLSDGRLEDVFPARKDKQNAYARRVSPIVGLTRLTFATAKAYAGIWYRALTEKETQALSARSTVLAALAEELVSIADESPGALTKVLLISAGVQEYLPYSVRDRVNDFEQDCRPMPDSDLAAQLGTLLHNGEQIFDSFDSLPLGIGTESQVHRAEHNGKTLAVKIRRKDVPAQIAAEHRAFMLFAPLGQSYFPNVNAKQIMTAAYQRTCKYYDARQEAHDLKVARAALRDMSSIFVPAVYDHLSNRDILTMDHYDGMTFAEVQQNCSQAERNKFGQLILESELTMLASGYYRFDIHPGNYLFAGEQLGYIDVQLVDLKESFLHSFDLIAAASRGDWQTYETIIRNAPLFQNLSAEQLQDWLDSARRYGMLPFTTPEFEFTPEFSRNLLQRYLHSVRSGTMLAPELVVFYTRFFGPLYNILGRLRAKGSWTHIVDRILERREKVA